MGKIVGIDLGTTYSAIAYIDDNGNPQIIQNSEGENTTPSTVLFGDDEVVVGTEAKKSAFMEPANFVAFAKRAMGDRSRHFSNEAGETFSPEAISALILKKLKRDAEAALNDVIDEAVVTVPAYFKDAERVSTQDAAKLAGIKLLTIINEPTAAALAYVHMQGIVTPETFLIYDLGGGTFDVSILSVHQDKIDVLAHSGNSRMGGFDFDNKIVEYCLNEAQKQGIDINSDVTARQSLQNAAEEAKKALSKKSKTSISLYVCGKPLKIEITREQFEELIRPLINRTLVSMEEALDLADLEYSDIDKIILVGGSTRIPLVKEIICKATGINPTNDVHEDQAVAIGAAYHAVQIKKDSINSNNSDSEISDQVSPNPTTPDLPPVTPYHFSDRTAHGIGVVIYDEDAGTDRNSVILSQNMTVPAESKQVFCTLEDYQASIILRVTQGEDEDISFVTVVGECEMSLPPLPAGSPIEITISCDEQSVIHVRVVDMTNRCDLGEMKLDRIQNLSEEQLEAEHNRLGHLNIGD